MFFGKYHTQINRNFMTVNEIIPVSIQLTFSEFYQFPFTYHYYLHPVKFYSNLIIKCVLLIQPTLIFMNGDRPTSHCFINIV